MRKFCREVTKLAEPGIRSLSLRIFAYFSLSTCGFSIYMSNVYDACLEADLAYLASARSPHLIRGLVDHKR